LLYPFAARPPLPPKSNATLWERRPRRERALKHLQQLNIKHQRAVRRDTAGRAGTVGQIRRNIKTPLGPFLHQLQGFGPTCNNAAYWKLSWLTALVGAVKHLTIDQCAFIMGTHSGAGHRRSTIALTDHFVLQTRRQGNHTVTLGIFSQIINPSLCRLFCRSFGNRLHFFLQLLKSLLQRLILDLTRLTAEGITQTGHHQINLKVGQIAATQLIAHLSANTVTDPLFVAIDAAHGVLR